MVSTFHLSDHPDISALLNRLLSEVQSILGDHFVGLYIHGSLAAGGFNPRTSDIDFLVVTEGELRPDTFSSLKAMHARIFTSGWAWSQKLEGAYLPKNDLRRHDPAHAPLPWLDTDGHFALERLGCDWILQRWILREKGITVSGPPLKALIDPVGPEDLRQAVLGSLHEWWSPPFPSPERFQGEGYLAFAVLTMCRSLYVLEHGRVASKPRAARWAKESLGEPWAALIAAAAAWKPGMAFACYEETVGFIYFTLKRWGLPSGD